MGRKTKIAWCDHTFNPWIGCGKVSPGCTNCYAERMNKHYHWVKGEWGSNYTLTGHSNWQKPRAWAVSAAKCGTIRRVFCASLADVFDEGVKSSWRTSLFKLISETLEFGSLEWLILTKRPENIAHASINWERFLESGLVRIGISAESQYTIDERLQKLAWYSPLPNFVSIEPMLQEIKLPDQPIDWVICGSESGPNARPFNVDWARSLASQCAYRGIPFFLKQMPVGGKLVENPVLDYRQYLEYPKRRAQMMDAMGLAAVIPSARK